LQIIHPTDAYQCSEALQRNNRLQLELLRQNPYADLTFAGAPRGWGRWHWAATGAIVVGVVGVVVTFKAQDGPSATSVRLAGAGLLLGAGSTALMGLVTASRL